MAEESEPLSRDQKSFKRVCVSILGIMAAVVLVIDFFTKSVGVVDKLIEWAVPQSTPLVHVSSIDMGAGGTCLKFGFNNLAEDFDLGTIVSQHRRGERANTDGRRYGSRGIQSSRKHGVVARACGH